MVVLFFIWAVSSDGEIVIIIWSDGIGGRGGDGEVEDRFGLWAVAAERWEETSNERRIAEQGGGGERMKVEVREGSETRHSPVPKLLGFSKSFIHLSDHDRG